MEVKGYEGFYEVSSLGRVRSLDRRVFNPKSGMTLRKGVVLTPNLNHKGYEYVGFNKNGVRSGLLFIHRLVANAFIENPNDLPQVNHIDGNKINNSALNLEWISNIDNQKHAVNNFLKSKNDAHRDSVLTNEQVLFLPKLFDAGMNKGMIARIYGVNRHAIMNILKGLTYRQIAPEINVKTIGHVKKVINLSKETYEELLTLIKDNTVLSTLISQGRVTV